ncbi:MAG: aspartyl protease family protein, partial [Novosphingobium sp.]|nr:aspartyl protease family protein [Novosphingobium sp.]
MATIAPALALLASPVLQGSFAPPLLPDLPEIRLEGVRTDRETRLTVPVTIEGKGPFRFVIDTGSQTTVVADSLAARLGLRSEASARFERGVDPYGIDRSIARLVELLAEPCPDLTVHA